MTIRLSEEFSSADTGVKSFLLPTIFARFCQIGRDCSADNPDISKEAFSKAHELVQTLADSELPLISIRLYLQGAASIQHCNFEGSVDLCYEFFTQAFVIYEEEISDSKEQVAALQQLTSTLLKVECFKEEEHASLRSQCVLAASRLLRKADQARAILWTSHVFWSSKVLSPDAKEASELRNEKKVVDQLKKASKTAEKCLEALLRQQLYIEILEKAHFYISDGLENADLQTLADSMSQKIKEKQNETQANADAEKLAAHFEELEIKMKGPSSQSESQAEESAVSGEINQPEEEAPEEIVENNEE